MLYGKTPVGRRDRKITLLQPVLVTSVSGGPKVESYEMLDSDPEPYAKVTHKLGSDVVQNDQVTHIQQAIFNVRYREDLNLGVKIVLDNKMYSIHSFSEVGETRKREIDITAEFIKDYIIT